MWASVQSPKRKEKNDAASARTAIVVSPTHREGKVISDVLRKKLKEKGLVRGEDHQFQVSQNLSFTQADKQDHLNYRPGQQIQFHQATGDYKAGTSYEVESIREDGTVMVRNQADKNLRTLPVSEVDCFQVYRNEQISLAEGDLIRITGNGRSKSNTPLNNGESYRVAGFSEQGDIRLDSGETLPKNYQNFNLGYYRTSHSAQGKDADDVLIAQSSLSFAASNEKQFYVSVSRGIERCRIYTDDKQGLKWAASQNSDRMSADEIAKDTKDQGVWLKARNQFHEQRQVEQARQAVQPKKKMNLKTKKEQHHEPTITFTRAEEPQITDFEI